MQPMCGLIHSHNGKYRIYEHVLDRDMSDGWIDSETVSFFPMRGDKTRRQTGRGAIERGSRESEPGSRDGCRRLWREEGGGDYRGAKPTSVKKLKYFSVRETN